MELFAYGTLMDTEIMAQVSGIRCRSTQAVLSGYIRKAVQGEVYPAIVQRNGSSIDGVVYFDLPAEGFDRIDAFEEPLYVRTFVSVALEGGEQVGAQTYVIAPEHIDRLSDRDWSFKRFLDSDKAEFQRGYAGFGKHFIGHRRCRAVCGGKGR